MYFEIIIGTYNAFTVKIKAKLYGCILNFYMWPKRGESVIDEIFKNIIIKFLAIFQFGSTLLIMI
jgi:hypothetical protein